MSSIFHYHMPECLIIPIDIYSWKQSWKWSCTSFSKIELCSFLYKEWAGKWCGHLYHCCQISAFENEASKQSGRLGRSWEGRTWHYWEHVSRGDENLPMLPFCVPTQVGQIGLSAGRPEARPLGEVALDKEAFTSAYEPAGPGRTHFLKRPCLQTLLFCKEYLLCGVLGQAALLMSQTSSIGGHLRAQPQHGMPHTYLDYWLTFVHPFSNVSWIAALKSLIFKYITTLCGKWHQSTYWNLAKGGGTDSAQGKLFRNQWLPKGCMFKVTFNPYFPQSKTKTKQKQDFLCKT